MPLDRIGSPYMTGSYPTTNGIAYIDQNVDFIQQQTPHQIQIVNANGVITNSVPAYITPDGRQIILQDIDSNDFNSNINSNNTEPPIHHHQYYYPSATVSQSPAPKSLIIQQKVAPSAYNQSSAFHATSGGSNSTSGSLSQLNRDSSTARVPQISREEAGVASQTPSRLTSTSSAVNLSAAQLQKPAQQLNREVVGSVTSLPGTFFCQFSLNIKPFL